MRIVSHLQGRKRGVSLTEILLTVGMIGVVSAITVPAIIDSTSRSSLNSVVSTTEDVTKAFMAEEAQSGLIPRTLGPTEVLERHLNQSARTAISNAGSIPTSCAGQIALPASSFSLPDSRQTVYVSDNWVIAGNGNDFADVCVLSADQTSVKRVYRGGASSASHNAANTANASVDIDKSTANDYGTGVDVKTGTVDGSSSGVTQSLSTAKVRIYSNNTNRQLSLKNYTVKASCPNVGYHSSGIEMVQIPQKQYCDISIENLNTPINRSPDAMYSPILANQRVYYKTNANWLDFKVNDTYKLALRVESPFAGDELATSVTVKIGDMVDTFSLEDSMTREFMMPAKEYVVQVSGRDVVDMAKTIRVQNPMNETFSLQNRWSTDVIQIVDDDDSSAGNITDYVAWAQQKLNQAIDKKSDDHVIHRRQTNLAIAQLISGLVGNVFVPQGRNVTLIDGVQRYVSTAMSIKDKKTNTIVTDSANIYSGMQPVYGQNGKLYLVGSNGIYVVDHRQSIVY